MCYYLQESFKDTKAVNRSTGNPMAKEKLQNKGQTMHHRHLFH